MSVNKKKKNEQVKEILLSNPTKLWKTEKDRDIVVDFLDFCQFVIQVSNSKTTVIRYSKYLHQYYTKFIEFDDETKLIRENHYIWNATFDNVLDDPKEMFNFMMKMKFFDKYLMGITDIIKIIAEYGNASKYHRIYWDENEKECIEKYRYKRRISQCPYCHRMALLHFMDYDFDCYACGREYNDFGSDYDRY